MNKIRKIIAWLWLHKERMTLLVMLGILAWYVYQVLKPPDVEDLSAKHKPPLGRLPEVWEEGPGSGPPDIIPLPPDDFSNIYRANPFWYSSGSIPTEGSGDSGDAGSADIKLTSIQTDSDGVSSARLVTQSRGWYKEGDSFESYQVLRIDATARTCEVYSEELRKSITLSLSGASR